MDLTNDAVARLIHQYGFVVLTHAQSPLHGENDYRTVRKGKVTPCGHYVSYYRPHGELYTTIFICSHNMDELMHAADPMHVRAKIDWDRSLIVDDCPMDREYREPQNAY